MLGGKPLDEGTVKNMNGDAAGPELEGTFGHATAGQFRRKVGVLDHLRAAFDRYDHAQLFIWRETLDNLE